MYNLELKVVSLMIVLYPIINKFVSLLDEISRRYNIGFIDNEDKKDLILAVSLFMYNLLYLKEKRANFSSPQYEKLKYKFNILKLLGAFLLPQSIFQPLLMTAFFWLIFFQH